MAQAVSLFHAKQMDPETGKPMSMRKLCQLVSDDHFTSSVAEVRFSPVLQPFLENREPN